MPVLRRVIAGTTTCADVCENTAIAPLAGRPAVAMVKVVRRRQWATTWIEGAAGDARIRSTAPIVLVGDLVGVVLGVGGVRQRDAGAIVEQPGVVAVRHQILDEVWSRWCRC